MAGNIKIIQPTSKYQKVSKGIIFDKEIDPFTLGIYVKVIALGQEWDLNIVGFASYTELTEAKIRKAFALLEKAGYLRRIHIKDVRTGHFTGWDYEIGVEPFPEDQRTNLAKIQPLENPHGGESKVWNNQSVENREVYNKDYKEVEIKKEGKKEFNFKEALLGLGISPDVVDTWLEVRRRAKAVNSEIAFKDLCTEIAKAGQPAEDCIRIAAANSWRGFRAEYLRPRNMVGTTPQAPLRKQESVWEANARAVENISRRLMSQPYDEQ